MTSALRHVKVARSATTRARRTGDRRWHVVVGASLEYTYARCGIRLHRLAIDERPELPRTGRPCATCFGVR